MSGIPQISPAVKTELAIERMKTAMRLETREQVIATVVEHFDYLSRAHPLSQFILDYQNHQAEIIKSAAGIHRYLTAANPNKFARDREILDIANFRRAYGECASTRLSFVDELYLSEFRRYLKRKLPDVPEARMAAEELEVELYGLVEQGSFQISVQALASRTLERLKGESDYGKEFLREMARGEQ